MDDLIKKVNEWYGWIIWKELKRICEIEEKSKGDY
jgi:hypothetical protein